ncbi:MAG: DNA polymerase III subunit beta [Candidatus Brocadiia bacterium]
MKFTVKREDFLSVCTLVFKAASAKSPSPALQGIKFSFKDGQMELQATDLDIAIRAKFTPSEVDGAEDFVLVPDIFLGVLREVKSKEVTFACEGPDLVLEASSGVYKFRRIGVEDFPELPSFPETGARPLAAGPLRSVFDRTVFCAAREKGRYAINGLFVSFAKESAEFAATDGRRLAVCTLKTKDTGATPLDAILPTRLVSIVEGEAARLSPDVEILFHSDGRSASFKVGDYCISGRLVEGEYPKYKNVIPANLDKMATIKRSDFVDMIKIAVLFVDNPTRGVATTFNAGRLNLLATHSERGESNQSMDIEFGGEQTVLGFNPVFIQEYLKVVTAEKIVFKFTSNTRAAMLEIADDPFEYKYVVMPTVVPGGR